MNKYFKIDDIPSDLISIPILEEISGLKYGQDFKIGYSPERINPGEYITFTICKWIRSI